MMRTAGDITITDNMQSEAVSRLGGISISIQSFLGFQSLGNDNLVSNWRLVKLRLTNVAESYRSTITYLKQLTDSPFLSMYLDAIRKLIVVLEDYLKNVPTPTDPPRDKHKQTFEEWVQLVNYPDRSKPTSTAAQCLSDALQSYWQLLNDEKQGEP